MDDKSLEEIVKEREDEDLISHEDIWEDDYKPKSLPLKYSFALFLADWKASRDR